MSTDAAWKDLTAGTVGGLALCLVGHPFDTLKVRLQTQPTNPPLYNGLVDCVRKTVAEEGLLGLYKGVSSPLAGMAFYNAVQFFSYGQAVEYLWDGKSDRLTIPQYFQAGIITGFAVSFVESPMDLFKSQLQTAIFKQKQNPGAPAQYSGVFDCAAKIYKAGGIRGLFQGLGPTIVRDVPAVALYFGTYEMAREYFALKSNMPVDKLEAWQLLSAGGVGGFFYWISTYPIDVIKSSMQADSIHVKERKYTSMIDCAQKLYAQGGIGSFFKGLSPCLLRSIPANAACFFAYEKTRQMLDRP